MARDLNLKVESVPYPEPEFEGDEYFKITWNDVYNERGSPIILLMILVVGVMLMFTPYTLYALAGTMVAFFVAAKFTLNFDVTFPRHINIGPHWVFCKGKRYNLADVTRFEYGLRSQLEGIPPEQRVEGRPGFDPFLIRMWINDSFPVNLAKNNWQAQVNHEIRDTLDKALREVRGRAVQEKQEAEYGKIEDDGIPDYD